jgi:hypothetical protein
MAMDSFATNQAIEKIIGITEKIITTIAINAAISRTLVIVFPL